mmetsp:Transcript_7510/g.16178  ORF Transcript_7510/g.16178 Transcript_7510/m.16178 type:complete len:226 (-) Transcript_7510:613-1290(-)
MFRWMASTRSSSQYFANICINEAISAGSRFQFSLENANTVKTAMCSAMHHLANSTTLELPSQCPLAALPYLLFPYLRFPSIMTATCLGTRSSGTPLSLEVPSSLLKSLRALDSRAFNPVFSLVFSFPVTFIFVAVESTAGRLSFLSLFSLFPQFDIDTASVPLLIPPLLAETGQPTGIFFVEFFPVMGDDNDGDDSPSGVEHLVVDVPSRKNQQDTTRHKRNQRI